MAPTENRTSWQTDVLWFVIPAAVYLVLSVGTLRSFGILWDEQTDIDIARSYAASDGGWFAGSTVEPTQTRLPMYAVAGVFALLGRTDLYLARLISCGFGVLTLLAVFVFARTWFGRAEAVLAAALLATSPLFLAFSRIAFTEGDAMVTAAIAWTILTLARALESRTVGPTALAGVLLGLAVSAKFLAIALIPVFLVAPWIVPRAPASELPTRAAGRRAVFIGCAVLAVAAVLFASLASNRPRIPEQMPRGAIAWSVAAVVYVSALLALARARTSTLGALAQPALALTLAAATFLLLPPVHLTSPVHVISLIEEMANSSGVVLGLVVEAASLHMLTLALKPGIVVGIVMWVCMLLALWRSLTDTRLRLPLLCIAAYLAFLLKMRLAQTFYTMPVFPWMLVLTAERLLTLWRRHRVVAAALLAAALASVAIDLTLIYPHYQLNGYQWIGARYVLGRSTIGYRAVAQVNSDGAQQALEWLNRTATPGDRVKTYIRPEHIIQAVSPHPPFELVDGLRPPSWSVDDADYVVTTLHADIRPDNPAGMRGGGSVFEYAYDRAALVRHFEPVFRVERPFGLEFATVWRRRSARLPPP